MVKKRKKKKDISCFDHWVRDKKKLYCTTKEDKYWDELNLDLKP